MTEVGAAPWDTQAAEPEKPARQKRTTRRPREAKPETEAAPARKPREKKVGADEIKISIKEYAEMRCAPAAKEFVKIHKLLADLPSLARGKVLDELQKVFG